MSKKLYQELAINFSGYQKGIELNNTIWQEKRQDKIEELIKLLPSGSGIDNGNKFDYSDSNDNKLIINSSFHRMDENGYYDGWIDYQVIIKASLKYGFDLCIKGKFCKHQDIKDYLSELYQYSLEQIVK